MAEPPAPVYGSFRAKAGELDDGRAAGPRLWAVVAVFAVVGVVSWVSGVRSASAAATPDSVVAPLVSVKGDNWTPWSNMDVQGTMREVYLPAGASAAEEGQPCPMGIGVVHVSQGPAAKNYLLDSFVFGYTCAGSDVEVWPDGQPEREGEANNHTLVSVSCAGFEPPAVKNVSSVPPTTSSQWQRILGLEVERYEISASELLQVDNLVLNATQLREFKDNVALRIRDSVRVRAVCGFDLVDRRPALFSPWVGRSEGELKQSEGAFCEPTTMPVGGRQRIVPLDVRQMHLQVFHGKAYDRDAFRVRLLCGGDPAPKKPAPPVADDEPAVADDALAAKQASAAASAAAAAAAAGTRPLRELDRSIGYIASHPVKDGRRGFFSHFVDRL